MKKVPKGPEPVELVNFRNATPNGDWVHFRRNRKRNRAVQDALLADQGGLCAYCEISLTPSGRDVLPDLRVDHFHPKSDKSSGYNWNLDWNNLVASCHGGSRADVVDSAVRFTSPDHSCDIPKGDTDLDAVILNPTALPSFPCFFSCNRHDGLLTVDVSACQQAGVDGQKAFETITRLRLNAPRLCNLRKPVLEKINEEIAAMIAGGLSAHDARDRMVRALLVKDAKSYWPAFFTSIRSYLGTAAEDHLMSIGYDG